MQRRLLVLWLNLLAPLVLLHLLAAGASTIAPDAAALSYEDDDKQFGRLLERAGSVTALNVGSSHGLAIDFEAFGVEGYHVWRTSGDMYEAVHIVEALAPRLPRLQLVLVAVSFPSLQADNVRDEQGAARRRQLYAGLPTWTPIPGDTRNFLAGKVHVVAPFDLVVRADHWKGVAKAAIGRGTPAPPVPRASDGQRNLREYVGCLSLAPEARARSAELAVAAHLAATDLGPGAASEAEDRAAEALERLVRGLEDQQVKVVLYTPPFTRDYLERYPPDSAARLRARVAALAEDLGIVYADFSQRELFAPAPRDFANADHLNLCGARRFSADLRQRLLTAASDNKP